MSLSPPLLQQIQTFRQDLHRHPELSGQEANTARRLQAFLHQFGPDQVVTDLGGHGLAVIYRGREPGPTVMIRSDMDALPIQEKATLSYRSVCPQVAHLCGHDGHMAIATGLAAWLHLHPIRRGRVVLLFQPAEETGCGAATILADPRFDEIRPDYIFGLHNLPQHPLGQVLIRPTEFAAASKGMIVRLKGATSHAAHPEHGISPALAMAQIITELTTLPQQPWFQDFVLVTVVHARLGEVAFGTAPGEAEVLATLRSYQDADMERLTNSAVELVHQAAQASQLDVEISWTDQFPATINHPNAVDLVRQAAQDCDLSVEEMSHPFRWSEDFGHYTRQCCGAFFGLGAGQQQPQLHNANYDFPDALIEPGVRIFSAIAHNLLDTASSS